MLGIFLGLALVVVLPVTCALIDSIDEDLNAWLKKEKED